MRKALVETLIRQAENDPSLFVLSADLGYGVFEPFSKAYLDRFINVGIAEADMIGVSAGLALCGKKAVAYSISTFATSRCLEQIRLDVCYHNLSVTVIGAGAGLCYGSLGPTHHGTEDIALMRALPNMTVLAPCDRHEFSALLPLALGQNSPSYIRIGRSTEPDVYTSQPDVQIGKGSPVKFYGDDFAILACGNMVSTALECLGRLKKRGFSGKLISMHTIKPLDSGLVAKLAAKMPIITIEEHSVIGGLGSAVAECISDSGIPGARLKRIAIPDSFQKKVGTHLYLRKQSGLDPDSIEKTVIGFLGAHRG